MKKRLLLLVSLIAVLTYSCKDDETPDNNNNNNNQPQELCDSLNITYDAHIKAIVDANCNTSSCHAVGAGGFMLGSYSDVKTAAMKENFLGAIRHEQGYKAMPAGGAKMSDEIIQQFECWEKLGFQEN